MKLVRLTVRNIDGILTLITSCLSKWFKLNLACIFLWCIGWHSRLWCESPGIISHRHHRIHDMWRHLGNGIVSCMLCAALIRCFPNVLCSESAWWAVFRITGAFVCDSINKCNSKNRFRHSTSSERMTVTRGKATIRWPWRTPEWSSSQASNLWTSYNCIRLPCAPHSMFTRNGICK